MQPKRRFGDETFPSVLYFGDGKTFHWVRSESSIPGQNFMQVKTDSEPYIMHFEDFRYAIEGGRERFQDIERVGKTWTLQCGKVEKRFVPVDATSTKQILGRAKQKHTPPSSESPIT